MTISSTKGRINVDIKGHFDDIWATTEGTEENQSMTQRGLAKKTGISFAYVSKLETGVMPPPRQNIILALAKVLGANNADTDELFGLARKMPSDLLKRVDTQMIRMLRSLEHGKETSVHELATSRRRIAELQASETQGIYENPSVTQILGDEPGEFVARDSL